MESCGVQLPQGQPAEALLAKAAGELAWSLSLWARGVGEKWDDTTTEGFHVELEHQHIK